MFFLFSLPSYRLDGLNNPCFCPKACSARYYPLCARAKQRNRFAASTAGILPTWVILSVSYARSSQYIPTPTVEKRTPHPAFETGRYLMHSQ
jgi:hypothetical protein